MDSDPFREGFTAAPDATNPYDAKRQRLHYYEWADGFDRADFARTLKTLPEHVQQAFHRAA